MARKRELPIDDAPQEKEIFERQEVRKAQLIVENENILRDELFQKIISSMESSWETLNEERRKKVLDAFEELLKAIKEYSESYRALKGIAKFKLSEEAGPESRKRYHGEISEKDRRERELHNAFLDAVNILSRRMKELGLDNSWRADAMIYPDSSDPELNRRKVKRWMFRVFGEQ
jgi:hypothetical protein